MAACASLGIVPRWDERVRVRATPRFKSPEQHAYSDTRLPTPYLRSALPVLPLATS